LATDETDAGVAAISLRGLRKRFGTVDAVTGVDLDIADGEFFAVLGPSGSGKTTILRIVAGFEQPTAGTVLLGGRDVTRIAPFDRDVNTVFQDYALFPHMTVAQNVGYGLRVKGIRSQPRERRVADALAMIRLDGFGDRKPGQLSGGQRQRVALARALVNRPRVLLLDEPLGALDLKLRQDMQTELKRIQREVGITFVCVTHDQEEALTMSDRVAVMNEGRIEQVGTPADVYERPNSAFVAGFVGTANLLTGGAAKSVLGREGTFSIRPEKIALSPASDHAEAPAEDIRAAGIVVEVIYLGSVTRFVVALDAGVQLVVAAQNRQTTFDDVARLRHQRVQLTWPAEHVIAVPADMTADRLPEPASHHIPASRH
jgi:putative spermidine/putrescine transport system ATP-binding protein